MAVEAADTSAVVSFAQAMPDNSYLPSVAFGWNAGNYSFTDKTTCNFRIQWQTPPGVTGATLNWKV